MYIVLFCNEFGEINHVHTPINADSYDAARTICKEYRNIKDGLFTRIYKCQWCPESATMNATAVETFADNIAS